MSLPHFLTQRELFSTAALSASRVEETDRYRLFAKLFARVSGLAAAGRP